MNSEALERAEEIRVVLDDVSGAAVASDTRVHQARAALDALLAEVARLEQELQSRGKELWSERGLLLDATRALAVAREREQRVVAAAQPIVNYCGNTGPRTHSPGMPPYFTVAANLVDALRAALADELSADESLTEEGGVNESSSGVHGQQMSPLPSPENDRSGRSSASTSPPAVSDSASAAADERICGNCDGLGLLDERDEWGFGKPCPRCNGTGAAADEPGEAPQVRRGVGRIVGHRERPPMVVGDDEARGGVSPSGKGRP